METQKINSALLSVYHKEGLAPVVQALHQHGVQLYSTGGTQQFIESLGIPVTAVEDLTGYPSVFGGRVKTLHPKIFGGILHRRSEPADLETARQYDIPPIDLVVVDLYPFEETVATGGSEEDIIEKIDIGGISLIRGAAKNFGDVLVVSHRGQYGRLLQTISENQGHTPLLIRKQFALEAFATTARYDAAIHGWFSQQCGQAPAGAPFQFQNLPRHGLRYGENPHQAATFYGDIDALFGQKHGKELSYNNLVDVDAALQLLDEFTEPTCVIVKHTNACGVATAATAREAYLNALACDPVSAFGGVIAINRPVDAETAGELNKLFMEIVIAPGFAPEALQTLQSRKNRIVLERKATGTAPEMFKTVLNGVLVQDRDSVTETAADMTPRTSRVPTDAEYHALTFALKVCKHTKSNTIVLARENQLLASGVGQTSRVDALRQAIEKATAFGFPLQGAVMASDAFFPFPDCVEIAHGAGIAAVVQPGGSIKDQDSIDYCNAHGLAMVFTGVRHFKH